MNNLLILTIAIVIVCNFWTLWLYRRMLHHNRKMIIDSVVVEALNNVDMTPVTEWLEQNVRIDSGRIIKAVREDGKLTRERIAQVKTRLADEERDDQRRKRRSRRKNAGLPQADPGKKHLSTEEFVKLAERARDDEPEEGQTRRQGR